MKVPNNVENYLLTKGYEKRETMSESSELVFSNNYEGVDYYITFIRKKEIEIKLSVHYPFDIDSRRKIKNIEIAYNRGLGDIKWIVSSSK